MDEKQKLDDLVTKANDTLLTVTSVFPFDLFPNSIRVDENKVDIIYRNSFFDKHLVSVLIKNISSVTLTTGVFFATLNLGLNTFTTGTDVKPTPISYLNKNDAIILKRIILGLITISKEGIDLTEIPETEKRQKIEEIGKAREFAAV